MHANDKCRQYADHLNRADVSLEEFLDSNVPAYLLRSKFDHSKFPHNQNTSRKATFDYAETYRRLKVPYYESARFKMCDALRDKFFKGMTEHQIFSAETMKAVIEKYSLGS